MKSIREVSHLHWLLFSVTLGFASVVEWAHFRRFQGRKDKLRMLTTCVAAIASGYMASEALEKDWPSWNGNGYAS